MTTAPVERGTGDAAAIIDPYRVLVVDDSAMIRGPLARTIESDQDIKVVATALHLDDGPRVNYCRPSVDPMLRSLAVSYGPRVLAIILTGMGQDGLHSREAVTEAGGTVIAQDQDSSVVLGMLGAVATAGLCSAVPALAEIGAYVMKLAVESSP